ncbi:MAG: NAD-dependent DNA ligase LigA [Myxococcota bacterium]
MDRKELEKQYQELIAQVKRHNYLYYVENDPQIGDREFDELYKKLEKFENNHPELVVDYSPTRRVGAKLPKNSKFKKREHLTQLLSLSNTYNISEIMDFFTRIKKGIDSEDNSCQVILEPKYDGISIELVYENGKLVRGVTRGDGLVGDDITQNIRTIMDIPLSLRSSYPGTLSVRGEVYLTFDEFDKINQRREKVEQKPFMNPRNAAGGTLHLKNPKLVASRKLQCFVYDLVFTDGPKYESHLDIIQDLKKFGFKTVDHFEKLDIYQSEISSEIKKKIGQWEKLLPTLPYPVDGIVFKVNSIALREKLGTNIKDPKWGFAYKFPTREVPTILKDIEYNIGRTGALTPVAILKPVLIDGSVVKRASLHNFGDIVKKKLNKGDKVLVKKAGEIIPQVIKKIDNQDEKSLIERPLKCPVCHSRLEERSESDQKNDIQLFCPNPHCKDRMIQSLIYFVQRNCMNIDLVGEKIITRLFESGLVRKPVDLYKLKEEDLLQLELIAEVSARKIIESIEKSKKVEFYRFIRSLGIPNVGEFVAKKLAGYFSTPKNMIEQIENRSVATVFDELIGRGEKEIKGIGKITAYKIIEYFQNKENLEQIKQITDILQIENSKKKAASGQFADLKFCLTGKLSLPRSEIKKEIEKNGGRVVTTVSHQTDYLVAGEKPGSKKTKAENLGVKILDEKQYRSLLN